MLDRRFTSNLQIYINIYIYIYIYIYIGFKDHTKRLFFFSSQIRESAP